MSLGDRVATAIYTGVERVARAWRELTSERSDPDPRQARRASIWKGAETSRLTLDWLATLTNPDDENRGSIRRLRARARELKRNNPWARQYLNLLRVNVIGPVGMKLQAQIANGDEPHETLNDRIERGWREWSRDVTIGVPTSLTELQNQLIDCVATEGEAFVRIWRGDEFNPHGLALEAIDPDLVDDEYNRPRGRDGNEIRMGVEVNRFGRPVAYHVYDSPASVVNARPNRTRMRIPADEILHLYKQDRVNQSRGITWFSPVMYAAKMMHAMDEAVLVGVRLSASAMGFFTKREDSDASPPVPEDGEDHVQLDANPGTFQMAPDGYDLKTWAPQHPNTNYHEFRKGQLQMFASGMGCEYTSLANDRERVNYSSIRAGNLSERDKWRADQAWWICIFLDRVYREWVRMVFLTGAVQLDARSDLSRFLQVRWVPRGYPWVDPLKETDSSVAGIQAGLTSRHLTCSEQGVEVEDVFQDLAREKRLAKKLDIEIEPKPASAQKTAPADDDTDDDDDEGDGESNAQLSVMGGPR